MGDYLRNKRENTSYAPILREIFGSEEELEGSENELMVLAKRLVEEKKALPRLYAWCGTEDFLYEGNRKVWAQMKELGYDLTCQESEGNHQWKYWDAEIQNVLYCWLVK